MNRLQTFLFIILFAITSIIANNNFKMIKDLKAKVSCLEKGGVAIGNDICANKGIVGGIATDEYEAGTVLCIDDKLPGGLKACDPNKYLNN